MTTRILITDLAGFALACLDGHHGARHAQAWADTVRADLAARGVETMVFELNPSEGGDHFRRDVLEQIGRVRPEFRRRPDGLREVVGFARVSAARAGEGKAAAAATPVAVRMSARIVSAPLDVHGPRQPIRIPRGRQNPAANAPMTDAERRHQRRLARATARGSA